MASNDILPKFFGDRADEVRARAGEMKDPVAKHTLELISDAYECLAERAKSRLLTQMTVPKPVAL